jgi:hypothetical protein
MERPAARWGIGLAASGAILLAAWAVLEFMPAVEEPASPGKTPNPSKAPWSRSIPGSEYSFAHGLVILVDHVLPGAGSLALATGLGLLIFDGRRLAGPTSRRLAASILGVLVLLAGVTLIGITIWQWRVRTAPMEPAWIGGVREIDEDSPFFGDFADWTPNKSDAYWERMRRRDRLDRLWWRVVLYGFPPMGLLLAATGLWLLASAPRRHVTTEDGAR